MNGGIKMCEQEKVLKKIKKIKHVTDDLIMELSEAQVHDYITLKRDVDSVKNDVASIKTEQAVQGGKLDLIIQRLNSPVEKERLDGQKWNLLTSIAKHKSAWIIVIIFLISIALSGEKIANIIEKLI